MNKATSNISPYEDLDERAYWKSAVAERHPTEAGDIYRKKFAISPTDRVVTVGSCFAQHITSAFRARGFNVLDAEPPPRGLSEEMAKHYGYRLFSGRYGNIYTARQLRNLMDEAFGLRKPVEIAWSKGARWYDAMRPSVDPEGVGSKDELFWLRESHIGNVRTLFETLDVLIFTLGLTEAWLSQRDTTAYPTAPGTIAGGFDPAEYYFHNFSYPEVSEDLNWIRSRIKEIRPSAKVLLTVSPVPLTATASGDHILAATIYSKSVLRAAAGELSKSFDDVDYFPSYEIIAGHHSRGIFYGANMRTVTRHGVDVAMGHFFGAHDTEVTIRSEQQRVSSSLDALSLETKTYCDEEVLARFAP